MKLVHFNSDGVTSILEISIQDHPKIPLPDKALLCGDPKKYVDT